SNGAVSTVRCQRILPSWRSRQSSSLFCSFSKQVVTKTRSPQTMGEECPLPGIAAFQRMFSFSVQWIGTAVSLLVPSPRGPRHCGQFSANDASHKKRTTAQEIKDLADISPPFAETGVITDPVRLSFSLRENPIAGYQAH